MLFTKTKLKDVYLLNFKLVKDKRGFFVRTFCQKEFERQGLHFSPVQSSLSFNKKRGTLRGMHFQQPPHGEQKVVSCLQGKIYDVVLDLRPNSSTYCQWEAIELSEDSYQAVYIPKGCAHGFQTLTNNSLIHYQISPYYHKESGGGVRWNDPVFKISWPLPVSVMSAKDKNYPDFKQTTLTKATGLER